MKPSTMVNAMQVLKCDLAIPLMRTAYGQSSFAFHGEDTWNNFHNDVKLAPSIQSFKANYNAHT